MKIFKKLGVLLFAGGIVFSHQFQVLAESAAKEVKMEQKAALKTQLKDIIGTLQKEGNFSTLLNAIIAANLVEMLKGPGPFTLFAPSDDAFTKMPTSTLEALLMDHSRLEKIILYHMLPEKKLAKQAMKVTSAKTVAGNYLTIRVIDGFLIAESAKVIRRDIPASNGVIHVIDTLLIPR